MKTTEEMIEQMYDSQLNSQKEQLKTDYETTLSDMDAQHAAAQKALDQKLRDTRVDSQRAAVNNAEYYAAAGLSSGARAQARLSQENQLLSNLTALRAAQQQADAETERQRTLLSKEYTSAIQKAQSDNDLARAQALYEEAKSADAQLLAKEEAAANLMAQTGDYSRLGALYGLTPEEIKKLSGESAKATVSTGGGDKYSGKANNYGVPSSDIIAMQRELGFTGNDLDGKWGPKTRKKADKKWGTIDPRDAWKQYQLENPTAPTYSSIVSDLTAAVQNGTTSKQGVSAYIHSAVSAGYISQNQAQTLLKRFTPLA